MKHLEKAFKSQTMRLAFRLMWERKSITITILACSLAFSLLLIVQPFAVQQLIDEGVAQNNRRVLALSIILFMFCSVSLPFLYGLGDVLKNELMVQVDAGLQGFLRRKQDNVSPFQLFCNKKPNELASAISMWTKGVSNSVASVIPELLESLFKLVLAFVSMWLISPLMTVVCIMSVAALIGGNRVLKKYTQLNGRLFEIQNKLLGHTAEFFLNFAVIQLYGASKRENKEFDRLREEDRKTRKKILWTKVLIDLFPTGIDAIVMVAVFLVGVLYFDILSPGQALQFIPYVAMFQQGVQWFYRGYTSVLEMVAELDQCDEILQLKETTVSSNASDLEKVYSIEFRGVTARYPSSETPEIRNLSLTIRQGEKIALVGKSGSGKTTLTHLLKRWIEPDSGEILINGRPIEEYTLESIRAKFSFCLQETGMLNRTIAENLKIGAPEATDEQLHEALFCAGLEEMNKDYLSQTSPGSGGQKQRLGVAQSLLHDGDVFVFDEFTSAVDKITEERMLQRMSVRLHDKTQIVIAHRYSTIRDADRVIVMENGEVVQVGTLHELRKQKDGLFYLLSNDGTDNKNSEGK